MEYKTFESQATLYTGKGSKKGRTKHTHHGVGDVASAIQQRNGARYTQFHRHKAEIKITICLISGISSLTECRHTLFVMFRRANLSLDFPVWI